MKVTPLAKARHYEAPNHFDMRAMRLQGLEEGGPEKFWIGLSYILPGGRAGPDAGAIEKAYVILEGELTLRANGEEHLLKKLDSVSIAPNETREIVNGTNAVVTMLVVVPKVES